MLEWKIYTSDKVERVFIKLLSQNVHNSFPYRYKQRDPLISNADC